MTGPMLLPGVSRHTSAPGLMAWLTVLHHVQHEAAEGGPAPTDPPEVPRN